MIGFFNRFSCEPATESDILVGINYFVGIEEESEVEVGILSLGFLFFTVNILLYSEYSED